VLQRLWLQAKEFIYQALLLEGHGGTTKITKIVWLFVADLDAQSYLLLLHATLLGLK
jgi:hypothetical protein